MAFRLLDNKPQYRTADGDLCAGGTLNFYITATTTAKSVYGEPALSTDLGSVITLDADARHSEDVWLDDSATAYRVILKDADGATIWQLDNVRSLDTTIAAGLPDAADGAEGQALLTDGTTGGWYFSTLQSLPDQTGHNGATLKTDGAAAYWEAAEAETTETESAVANGYRIRGDVMECWGSDTAPTAASLSTTKAVTFASAMGGAPWHVSVTPNISSGVTSNSPSGYPNTRWSSGATTGFTAGFFVGEENNGGTDTITSTIPFTYYAIGPAP